MMLRKLRNIRRAWPVLFLLAAAGALIGARQAPDADTPLDSGDYLVGKLLIATPSMGDPRFKETVIFMVEHDSNGALGLVVNRVIGRVKLAQFFDKLGIESKNATGSVPIHYGGPVQPHFGFVIHSAEFRAQDTRLITTGVAVSPEPGVLGAIARGEGPKRTVFAVGYAGWAANQLEHELDRNDWYTAPADLEIVFDKDLATKWQRAVEIRYRTL